MNIILCCWCVVSVLVLAPDAIHCLRLRHPRQDEAKKCYKCKDAATCVEGRTEMDCAADKVAGLGLDGAVKDFWDNIVVGDAAADADFTHCVTVQWGDNEFRSCVKEKVGEVAFCEFANATVLKGAVTFCATCDLATASLCNNEEPLKKDVTKADSDDSGDQTTMEDMESTTKAGAESHGFVVFYGVISVTLSCLFL